MQRLQPFTSVSQRHSICRNQIKTPAALCSTGNALRRQQRQRRPLPPCCSASAGSSSSTAEAAQLLDQFWLARGVVEEEQRRYGARWVAVTALFRKDFSPGNAPSSPRWPSSHTYVSLLPLCPAMRRRLVAAAGSLQQLAGSEEGYEELELPSLSAAWFLGPGSEGSPEVSDRLLCLRRERGAAGKAKSSP